MNFNKQMKLYTDAVNSQLDKVFSVPDNFQKNVYEAMRYSIMAGGKRIRPIFALAVCDMLGGNLDDAMRFGIAIECIHTYSLIHDDLPCMDNDDFRRGKLTCHKMFGETTALLAGDGLLTFAFEYISDFEKYSTLSAQKVLQMTCALAKAAGCDGMIGGQVVDIEGEKNSISNEEHLTYMHKRKTGELIRAAALAGAICGNSDEEETKKIIDFASDLGLAFQIKDDILDFLGDEKILGKPIGSDADNGKTTYVTLLGIDEAQKRLNQLTNRAIENISDFGNRAEFLVDFAQYLLKREN